MLGDGTCCSGHRTQHHVGQRQPCSLHRARDLLDKRWIDGTDDAIDASFHVGWHRNEVERPCFAYVGKVPGSGEANHIGQFVRIDQGERDRSQFDVVTADASDRITRLDS